MKLTEAFDAPKRKWVVKKLSDLDQDVLEAIWDMFEHTYKSIGLVVNSLSELAGKYKISLLIDVDKDPMPDAFTIYKPTKFGAKMVLAGTDGSKPAKSALVKHKLVTLKKRGWYVEASHRIADILMSNNINVIDNQEDVEKVLGKKVKWKDDDGQYERSVGGGSISATKRLFGNPKI
jgi:hypothetical protein